MQFSFPSFRRAFQAFTLGSLLTFAAGTAAATGLVDGFNVTVFNNFKSQYTDLQGTLAVGKNLSLTGYALNQSAPNPNTAAGGFDTVVGGSMLFSKRHDLWQRVSEFSQHQRRQCVRWMLDHRERAN